MLEKTQLETGESAQAANTEYERLREMLDSQVSDFADEHEVSFEMLSLLLIDCGVTNALTRYLLSVDKPSAVGLKLELDRFATQDRELHQLAQG